MARYDREKLNEIMEFQGRRNDWLAAQIGIDPSYVSKLRTGERVITDELAEQIARALGVPQGFLTMTEPEDVNDHASAA